jgi:hypothetical protein
MPMWYLATQLVWLLLVAFAIGVVVGWTTSERATGE